MSSSTPPPPPEVTTEPTASDQEIARLRERVKELEARLAPPEPRTATNDQPQFSSIVLFGADGNLATKKTFPTLFALWRKKLLPRDIVIVGYAREAMDTETFRKNIVRSRRPAVPSRRRRASCPSSDEVGGFCFDSEAVRTASRDHDAPRRSTRPSTRRLTPSGSGVDFCSGCTTARGNLMMLRTCGSASRPYFVNSRPNKYWATALLMMSPSNALYRAAWCLLPPTILTRTYQWYRDKIEEG